MPRGLAALQRERPELFGRPGPPLPAPGLRRLRRAARPHRHHGNRGGRAPALALQAGVSRRAGARPGAGGPTARAWAMPALVTASYEVYARLAWLWIKMGALVYGGGYVIIPVVRGEAVQRFGWMSDRVFLDGLALGQMTPGPIVNLSVFVGYQR